MFITRLGDNSKMVITGDTSQIDLPKPQDSGLVHAERVLQGVRGVEFHNFLNEDIVRHHTVSRVVAAYEQWEATHVDEQEVKRQRKTANVRNLMGEFVKQMTGAVTNPHLEADETATANPTQLPEAGEDAPEAQATAAQTTAE